MGTNVKISKIWKIISKNKVKESKSSIWQLKRCQIKRKNYHRLKVKNQMKQMNGFIFSVLWWFLVSSFTILARKKTTSTLNSMPLMVDVHFRCALTTNFEKKCGDVLKKELLLYRFIFFPKVLVEHHIFAAAEKKKNKKENLKVVEVWINTKLCCVLAYLIDFKKLFS